MIALNTQIANTMEQQQTWPAENEQKNAGSKQTEDDAIQELAEQFGLGITRQGGNY